MKTYPFYNNQSSDISKNYYKMICHSCDSKALNKSGKKSKYLDEYYPVEVFPFGSDDGDNPVFWDGQKCWRRFKFGGYVTIMYDLDCDTLEDFYDRTFEKII
ncbi:hypothetical protein ACFL5D_04720 [Candidatus Neomarinimicrobiota bacterium]